MNRLRPSGMPFLLLLGFLLLSLGPAPMQSFARALPPGAGAALPASAPAAPPQYRVELLGNLPGQQGTVPWGINEHGHVVGWSGFPAKPFLYTDSAGMVPLALPAGYNECVARDINDHGEVAGTCGTESSGDFPQRAFRWSAAGVPQELGTLGGATSEAWAINNAGNVTGTSNDGSFLGHHAFLYTDELGMVDLLPGTGYSPGYDINEVGTGQVTGYRGATAFRWTNGTLEVLGVPEGFSYSYGFAINDLGHVAGSAKIAGGNTERVFRYTDGAGWENLGGTGSTNQVWDMNNSGTIIGDGRPSGGIERAFIYTDEIGMQDLGDYIVQPPNTWRMLRAHGINDAGQIVGLAIHIQTGDIVAARLTPLDGPPITPTPTATSLPSTPTAPATSVPATPTATTPPGSATQLYLPLLHRGVQAAD